MKETIYNLGNYKEKCQYCLIYQTALWFFFIVVNAVINELSKHTIFPFHFSSSPQNTYINFSLAVNLCPPFLTESKSEK